MTVTTAPFRVVVADDGPDDRAEVRRLLLCGSERRYVFVEAETGDATVQAVRADGGPPDCLVLDYHLPDADAPEVLAALAGPDGGCVCAVVVLTGGDGRLAGGQVLRAGAQDFLGKQDMTAQSLTRAVENAIERHRMAVELREREADRERTEEALRQSESFYRQTLESIPGLVFTNAPDGACDYVNEQWVEFTGVPAVEHLGDGWLRVLHPDDRARAYEAWRAAVEGRGKFDLECRVRRADGGYEWFKGRGRAIRDTNGVVARWFGAAVNVDDLKRAEAALEEADRRKDEFLATLAHELRNPLAPLRNGLAVLRRSEAGSDAAARAQGMMERQLSHLVRLVDDLLDVSRISRGMVKLEPQRVALATILDHAVETTRPLVDAGGHVLTVRTPDAPVWVHGDLTRLAQVVGNLLNNAAKYTPSGGHVDLWAGVERSGPGGAPMAVVRVTDDGTGIAPDMLPRVFDLFAQVDRTLDRAQGGLGIGLSLVRRLVEMHGGTITAHSDGLGRGSSFTVRLPLANAPEKGAGRAAVGPEGRVVRSHPRRVLVVDDNRDAAETLAMLLSIMGHEATTAHSGPEALEVARARRPEVVFLDIGMPGMDGYEVARRLRADPATAAARLVALTGWGSEDDKRRSQEAGFDVHLTKPVEPAAVSEVLAEATARERSGAHGEAVVHGG